MNKLTATEAMELQKFKEKTDRFAGELFEWASTLGVQYLLPHMWDLQQTIQEKLNGEKTLQPTAD